MLYILIIIGIIAIGVVLIGCSKPDPKKQITAIVDRFAREKGHFFGKSKDLIIDNLVNKQKNFGRFYCPCKLDHTPQNVCPCLDTRNGEVDDKGRCYCGLFWKEPPQEYHYEIDQKVCVGCGRCLRSCSAGAIAGIGGKPHSIHAGKCIGCGKCFEICPVNAVRRVDS